LQALVRADILKGVRGPRGGYELARERRRISAAEVVRAVMNGEGSAKTESRFVANVIAPVIERAGEAFLGQLELVTIDDICRVAGEKKIFLDEAVKPDFTI
ncbi:MAG: Rrf2 family transcriptional regulator, partial [Methylovirgula sp.]